MAILLNTFSVRAAAGVGPLRTAAVKLSGWLSKPMIRSTACACSFILYLSLSFMQTDGNGSGALHALRYAGPAPCRCFAPVLIHGNGELLLMQSTSISR